MPLAALLGQEPNELSSIGSVAVGFSEQYGAPRHPQSR
jgi:hypothetical protein